MVAPIAFSFPLAEAPALAKTSAECAKEYATKKSAGEASGQSEAAYVKACLAGQAAASDPPAQTQGAGPGSETKGQSDTDLAKKIQNPIGDLYSFPFQSNTNFGFGPHKGTQEILNIQPVIPLHITPDWNIITRTILPLVWNPDLSPAPSVPFGTAPTTFSAFLSPAQPTNGWLWGLGPVILKTAVGRLEVAAFCDFARSGCVSLARDAAAGATIDL